MDDRGRNWQLDRAFSDFLVASHAFTGRRFGGSLAGMTPSNGGLVSARERARRANAQRLADAQSRLKNQEQDLIAYFDATRDERRITNEVTQRIARFRRDAQSKLDSAYRRRAEALAELKKRGETYSSIATLVDLSVPEATRLIKSTMAAKATDGIDAPGESADGSAASANEDADRAGNSDPTATATASVDEAAWAR